MKVTTCDYCEKEIKSKTDMVLIDIGIIVEIPMMGDLEYDSGEIDLCKECTKLIEIDLRTTFIRGMAAKFMHETTTDQGVK